jgi:hypothetical protein
MVTFKEFFESFNSAVPISWQPPFKEGSGTVYRGVFEAPVIRPVPGYSSPVVQYQIRLFVEPALLYRSVVESARLRGLSPDFFRGSVVRISFGRKSPYATAAHGFTPTTPRPDEPGPDEMVVFATVMNGFAKAIKDLSTVAIFSEAHQDSNQDTFQTRKTVYHKLYSMAAKKVGYIDVIQDGKNQMAIRRDLLQAQPIAA